MTTPPVAAVSDSARTPPGKKVLLAAPRGYCAGVHRAVIAVERALEQYGEPIYVRHEIVHNKYVVEMLKKKGVIFVQSTDEVPPGNILIFSAHGVSPGVRHEAKDRGLATIDATCPLVTKVHQEVIRYARDGYEILLIGHEDHEEVVGVFHEAPEKVRIVNDSHDVDTVDVHDPSRLVWLSQTTLSVDETRGTAAALKQRFPLLEDPPSDDICYAAQNRQTAVKKIAAADLVIVIGSLNSSNSIQLVNTALAAGAGAARLVDRPSEVDETWLESIATLGLTAGASVPEALVDEMLEWLAERGWDDVEVVATTEEHITFSLRKELRRDLRNEPPPNP